MRKLVSMLLAALLVLSCVHVMAQDSATTLEYWIAGDPIRTPVYEESVALFTEKTGIKVNITEEVGNHAQIQQKLYMMIASGDAPDVLHMDTMYVADMAKAGTLLALDDFEGFTDLYNSVIEKEITPLQVDGKTYGFPIRGNSIQLVYNKQLFREAGLDPENPPRTLDELIEAAIALTQYDENGNVEVYGFEVGMTADPHWTLHAFSPIFWAYGGEYLNEDGTSGFASEAGVKTLELWDKLINELGVSPAERVVNGFEAGKLAMTIDGEWKLRGYSENFPDLEVGFTTIPMPSEDVVPQIPLGGRACVIPIMSENPQEAWRLIQHVLSYDEQMRYTKAEVGLGVLKEMVNDPWFNTNVNYRQALEDMQYAKPKAAPEIMQMDTFVSDAIQNVILMGEDPMTALEYADQQYNELLQSLGYLD